MMAHAEVCPVCNGRGTVKEERITVAEKQCYGCGGKGWVNVEEHSYYPYYPYYPYYYPNFRYYY